jgi:nucleoside-diphosphate-sugar epimerase
MRRACARLTTVDFATFALSQLPPPPARVLEIGCGCSGGVTPALAAAGYDALGIDREPPSGANFRAVALEDFDDEQSFDAAVAERVFHHVHPLGSALDKVARMAPLLILDEFAWDRIDDAAREWYEGQRRALVAAGREPIGPPDLTRWREEHDDLHASDVIRREVSERFEERYFEWRPYLYRWLEGPASEQLEQALIDARVIQPIGFRWIGVRR